MGKKLIKNLINNNYYYKMLRWCIKYINNVTTIKIIKRKFCIFCDKHFNYFPTNQLICFASCLSITNEKLKYLPNITDKGLQYLPNLTYLCLWKNTNITAEGLKCLRKLKIYNWTKID